MSQFQMIPRLLYQGLKPCCSSYISTVIESDVCLYFPHFIKFLKKSAIHM